MSSTREIKQRIKNIESVEQLISAMHMVASTQLRRANRQLDGVIPVEEALNKKVEELASHEEVRTLPFYERREVKNSLYLILTGDRGLAGSYNNKVQRFALEEMAEKNEQIIVVGSYGHRFFERNQKTIVRSVIDLADSQVYYGSENIANWLLESFLEKKVDEVFLVYTEFENVLSSNPRAKKLLPLPLAEPEYNYEDIGPDLTTYVENLVPFYLHMCVFRAFSEAHTSEHASRMIAMDAAGGNARDLIKELQRNLNRQRQQEITQELSEIIGQNQ